MFSSAVPTSARSLWTMDLVHDNPGEPPTVSGFNEPATLATMGYRAKCYQLFDSAILALTWEQVDPAIFPPGSEGRLWVDRKASDLQQRYQACQAAGLEVYCMSDLILLPRRLVEMRDLGDWRDPRNPEVQRLLRLAIAELCARFPELNGLVVRIGETYLHDAPHHVGGVREKTSVRETIVPLIQLLREELCVRHGRRLIFRTWLSFDVDLAAYEQVSELVEPHPLLWFSVKHCEGDFHRGNRFSRVLGAGRHPQIVEVQCQREYEGKGAHPNYIVEGVVSGFEEYAHTMPAGACRSLRELLPNPRFVGVWTWSRGGGWLGPYVRNELWCRLNAWVMIQWAREPADSADAMLARFGAEQLGLQPGDLPPFLRLCHLSAAAVLRGKRSTHADLRPWWSRDHFIRPPDLPKNPVARARVLEEKREAEALWGEICDLARRLRPADPVQAGFIVDSSDYGRHLYRIFRIVFELAEVAEKFDAMRASRLIKEYEDAWAGWRAQQAQASEGGSLYCDDAFRYHPGRGASGDPKHGAGALVARLRARLAAAGPKPVREASRS